MWRNRWTLAIGALLIGSGHAVGSVKYFRPAGTTAQWSDNVWYDSAVGGSLVSAPDEADRAVILSGKICEIENASEAADSIVVQSGADLVIYDDGMLTLDNDDGNTNGAFNSDIDGVIYLLTDSMISPSAGGTLDIVAYDHGFGGDGKIEGECVFCTVYIDDDITLTNRLIGGFVGSMTISGDTGTTNGEFRNDSLVHAGLPGDDFELVLASTTILSDHDTVNQAVWLADGGTLVFDGAAEDLDGNIYLDCKSVLDINADVKTCGTWTWVAGQWSVESGATYKYYTYTSGTANPGTDLCPSERCDCLKWGIAGSDSGSVICP